MEVQRDLLSLNEHCLEQLCDFLDLEDQIALSRVCEFFQDFFVHNFWKWKCQRIFLIKPFWMQAKNEAYFPTLIRIAASSVQTIELDGKHIQKFGSLLIGLEFPKLRTCVCRLNENDQLLKLNEIFPNIKELYAEKVLFDDVVVFKELEILHLYTRKIYPMETYNFLYLKCPNLKKIAFHGIKICKFLQVLQSLPALEEVSYQTKQIKASEVHNFRKIKNLRTINVYADGNFPKICYSIKIIEVYFGEAIDTIVLSYINMTSRRAGEIFKLNYLRCLVLYKAFFESDRIEELCRNLPTTLKEFYYLERGNEYVRASCFLPLINRRYNLQILYVSGYNFTEKFVADVAKEMSVQDRQQDLLLYCIQTRITKKQIEDLTLPGNLQVFLSKPKQFFKTSNFECRQFRVQLDRSRVKEEYKINFEEVEMYKKDFIRSSDSDSDQDYNDYYDEDSDQE